jgi:hypothetical protein
MTARITAGLMRIMYQDVLCWRETVGLLQTAERVGHRQTGIAVRQMDCRVYITDVGYVHCEVRSVSDVTPVLRGELYRTASITGMKNKNFGQSRSMEKKII